MTGSNFVFATRPYLKSTAIPVKTPLKSIFAFFYSLSRLFQLAYFVKCWRTLPEVECVTPHGREMLEIEKTSIKKGNLWANSGVACVLLVLFTPLGEMITLMKSSFPSIVFCVFGCIFHLRGVLDTKI